MTGNLFLAGLLGAAGLAASASASISIGPSDVITWGNTGAGRSLAGAQPAGAVWAWFNTVPSQSVIDSNGRVYFQGNYRSTPHVIGTSATGTHRAYFTATNSTDIAAYDGLYDGGTKDGLDLRNAAIPPANSTIGGIPTIGVRVSGTRVGVSVQFSGAGINETGASQNNSAFYMGTAGGSSRAAQRNDSVTLNDTSGAAVVVNHNRDLRGIPLQNSSINASGTAVLSSMTVPVVAGSFASTANATAAPFGNNGFITTKTVGGAYEIVAQGGQSTPGIGGGRYQNGSNGVGGSNAKINANGLIAYDAKACTNFPVTATTDDLAYIHTPGSGSTLVYREGNAMPDATGAPDAGGARYGNANPVTPNAGIIGMGNSCFSNAGMLFTAQLKDGDTVFSSPAGLNQNDLGLFLATPSSTVRVLRRNDPTPYGAGVRAGTVNQFSAHINNGGFTAFGVSLQGENVTNPVQLQFDFGNPPRVAVAGVMGNNQAIYVGTAGSLQPIVRMGDAVPGTPNLYFNFAIGGLQMQLNNSNEVLFVSDLSSFAPGQQVGAVGQLSSEIQGSTQVSRGLFGWSSAFGLVPLLASGQSIELDTGVFKTVSQFNLAGQEDGNGGSSSLNDDGKFVVNVTYTDGSWSVITLQIPAPGTGALVLVGLGMLARRRRN